MSRDSRWHLPSLLVLCVFTFFVGLGRPAITDSDEAYYAEASREMVETGDWLTPRFNYENRWQKPILYYWLTASVFQVAGPSEFGARFWSAVSGVALALLAFGIARDANIRGDASWLAAAIVATCSGYVAMGRSALPDLPLTACITLGIWSALRAANQADSSGLRWWALTGFAAGLGFTFKGPVALVVPGVVLLPIAWRERGRLRLDPRGIALAAVLALLVGLPWYIAMWNEHGTAYLQSFFIGDNLERFATERFNAPRPLWFYIPVLLGGLMPWSLFFVGVVGEAINNLRRRAMTMSDADWRLLLWTAMPLLFYTLSIGKQPRYILPILPPIAVFISRGITRRIAAASEPSIGWVRTATWATAAVYAGLVGLMLRVDPVFINTYPTLTIVAVCAIAGASMALGWVALNHAWRVLPGVLAVAAAVVLLSVQFGAISGRRPEAVEEISALIRAHRVADEPIGTSGPFARNLPFYTKASRVELFGAEQVAMFVGTTTRVLLVMPTDDVSAVAKASGVPLRTLGTVRYLNSANFRARTLLGPDPAREIQTMSLVTNR